MVLVVKTGSRGQVDRATPELAARRCVRLLFCQGRTACNLGFMMERSKAIEEAERAGFDLSLVDENLALRPEDRARRHDQALDLVLELDRIRRERDAKFESSAAAAG